jgi:Leucine-rich repeat (LRR) protein
MQPERNMADSQPKRRWFRFSLRTLLIAFTLCGVWLGYTMHQVRARRDAIRAIDANGGTYGVYIVGPKWLRCFIPDEKCFYDASRVSLGPGNQGYDPTNPFTDEDLVRIIPHLNQFQHFESLYLSDNHITDDGLRCLKDLPTIRRLELGNTSVTDNCVPYLAELKTLKELDISQTGITEEGMAKLQTALPNCKIR